jgi:hypothetical protein
MGKYRYNELYKEISNVVGKDKIDELIRLERANNQRYYAGRINQITKDMIDEATRYEEQNNA